MALAEQFWTRVTKSDGCWPWSGARGGEGYGQLQIKGRYKKAHRVAYELAVGPIPDGLAVMHTCDNRPCCNPAHLRLGTWADNNRDRALKGRSATGDLHGSRTHPEALRRGEAHARAKLREGDVRDIRAAYRAGATQVGLALHYGVSRRNIRAIVDRVSWRWLS